MTFGFQNSVPAYTVGIVTTEHFFKKLWKLLPFVAIWKTALCERCVLLHKDAFECAWLLLTLIGWEWKQRWLVLGSVLLACELIHKPLCQGLLSRQWAWAASILDLWEVEAGTARHANMGICGSTALKYFLESWIVPQKANFWWFRKGSVYV